MHLQLAPRSASLSLSSQPSAKHADWLDTDYTGPLTLSETHTDAESANDAMRRRSEKETKVVGANGVTTTKKVVNSQQRTASTSKVVSTTKTFGGGATAPGMPSGSECSE